MHLPSIIQDLAIILIVAGAMTLLFRALKQPTVLGYIIAGFLVGPHFEWLPTVMDTESIKVWAEIGVIFLLFALGLEFSFKKLARVGAPASITALVEVAGMIALGFFVGKFFDWSSTDSMFLGGILAISSTTIIIRAFEELEMKTRGFVRLVFGVLIVEDLVAILLMVLLSTIAVSQAFSGMEMGYAALKLAFFLTLWFVLGIFLIPTFFKRVRSLLKPETLLIVSLGLCFLMVVFATKVGFSPALGAFIMGSILAETIESDRIEHLIHPVKDLFGAIFFVSVGMLINPTVLVEYAYPIMVITLVTVFGKLITTTAGALLAGQSLRHSVQAGMSLAQIGEFSFIIASLGLSLKVTSDFLYPIAISVSAITTFTTPYLIRSSDTVVALIERKVPMPWLAVLERFQRASATVSQLEDWKTLLQRSVLRILANAVVVVSIFWIVGVFLIPWLETKDLSLGYNDEASLFLAFVLSAPFIWAIAAGKIGGEAATNLWREGRFRGPLFVLELLRWSFAIILCSVLASLIVPLGWVLMTISGLVVALIYFLPRHFERVYLLLEARFVGNLNEREASTMKRKLPALAPWDSHLVELLVSSESSLVGHKLSDLTLRERFGVTIALIARGQKVIPAPGRNDVIYPGDVLKVIGTDDQILRFRAECEPKPLGPVETPEVDYILRSLYIEPSSPFAQKSIRDCGLREQTHGLVVGIEKGGRRTLNPDSAIIIEPGDILWVVGDQKLMMGL